MTAASKDLREEGAKALEALKVKEEAEERVATTALPDGKAGVKEPESDPEPTPEEAEAIRETKKARIAQIMSGGILNERMQSIVDAATPDGFKSKFVMDSKDFIIRYSNLGFGWTYKEGSSGLHDTSDGRIRVGDLVLMTIAEEDHSILDEVRTDKVKKKLSAGRDEYHSQMRGSGQEEGIIDDSETVVTTSRS